MPQDAYRDYLHNQPIKLVSFLFSSLSWTIDVDIRNITNSFYIFHALMLTSTDTTTYRSSILYGIVRFRAT